MNAGQRLVNLIALYISEIRELRTANTAKLYAESMRQFAAYGISLDNNALVAYERALKHDKHKSGTVQTRLAGLRAFYDSPRKLDTKRQDKCVRTYAVLGVLQRGTIAPGIGLSHPS
jgi:hypothetical protein